jgi:hypothetical protein
MKIINRNGVQSASMTMQEWLAIGRAAGFTQGTVKTAQSAGDFDQDIQLFADELMKASELEQADRLDIDIEMEDTVDGDTVTGKVPNVVSVSLDRTLVIGWNAWNQVSHTSRISSEIAPGKLPDVLRGVPVEDTELCVYGGIGNQLIPFYPRVTYGVTDADDKGIVLAITKYKVDEQDVLRAIEDI